MQSKVHSLQSTGARLTADCRLWTILALLLIFAPTFAQRTDVATLMKWEAEGDTLMAQQRFDEAAKMFSKIVDATQLRERAAYNALYKRAVAYYYGQQDDLALKDLEVFQKQFSSVPQSFILKALIYRNLDNAEGQLEALNTVLNFQPSNTGMLKWRAGLFLDKQEYKKAKQDAETAILFEDDAEAEGYLAFAYFNLAKPDSALHSINKAIELDYTYAPAYLYAGSFCLQSSENELALTYLNLGLKVAPTHPVMLFYKGVALVELEKMDEGCRFLNKAFYAGHEDAGDYLKEYCYTTDN